MANKCKVLHLIVQKVRVKVIQFKDLDSIRKTYAESANNIGKKFEPVFLFMSILKDVLRKNSAQLPNLNFMDVPINIDSVINKLGTTDLESYVNNGHKIKEKLRLLNEMKHPKSERVTRNAEKTLSVLQKNILESKILFT